VFTVLSVHQDGAGQVTLTGATGVTFKNSGPLKTRGSNSVVQAVQVAANSWLVFGDLEPQGQVIADITGATYTPVTGDANALIRALNATGTTVSIPANANVAFPTGTHMDFEQTTTGQVIVTGATGVTVSGTPTTKGRAQYSGLTAVKVGTNTWWVVGDAAVS
jgi:2-keto-4-pentenoate hydratase